MKRIAIYAVLLAFCLMLATGAQAEPVKLAYKYKAGEFDKYRVTMTMNMSFVTGMKGASMPPMSMKMSVMVKEKTLGVLPDGSAKVRTTYSDFKLSGEGMTKVQASKMKMPTMPAVVMTRTPDGRVTDVEGVDKATALGLKMDMTPFMSLMGNQGMFPAGPVEIGESWSQAVPLPFGGCEMNVTSTLRSVGEKVIGVPAAKVQQAIDARLDIGQLMQMVAGALPIGGEAADVLSAISGHVDIVGTMEYAFAPARGKMLASDGFADMIMVMNLPQQLVKSGAPPQVEIALQMKFNYTRV